MVRPPRRAAVLPAAVAVPLRAAAVPAAAQPSAAAERLAEVEHPTDVGATDAGAARPVVSHDEDGAEPTRDAQDAAQPDPQPES